MATRPAFPPASATLCDWTVQTELNRVVRGQAEVVLEPRVMQVLACLLAAEGQPVTRDQLMAQVWGHEFVTEDALNRCISKLRKVIAEDLGCAATIETLPKVGYRLVQPQVVSLEQAPTTVARPPRAPLPWPWIAGVAAAALAGAGLTLVALREEAANGAANEARQRPLTTMQGNEEWPSLSPDGSLVAFSWRPNAADDFDVFVQPVNADTPLRITDHPAHEVAAHWSPDGTTLAFMRVDKPSQSCEIFTVAPTGGPATRVTDCNYTEWSLTWTPDGSGLVFLAPGGTGLVRHTLADGTRTPLSFPPADYMHDGAPSFSADGTQLAFTRWRSNGVGDVHVMPAEGGVPKRITFDNLKVHGVAWEPDGRHLIYSSNRAGPFALWRVSVDGDAPRRIPISGRSADGPHMSRDGRRLVYEEFQGQTNIFSLDSALPQRPPVQITHATRWDWHPAASPDGARLAFASDRSGSAEIWVSAADGRNPLKLTAFDGPYSSSPSWSPDGQRIAFDSPAVEGNFDLYLVDAAGGAPQRLTTNPAEDRYATFAPDGRTLYFASRRTGDWEVWRIDLASRVEQQVTRGGGYYPQLSRDGRTLYFSRINQAGIFRQPINDPSALEPVIDAPSPVDCANWRLVGDTLWFVLRGTGPASLAAHDLASGTTRVRLTLPELTYKSGVSVDNAGRAYFASMVRNETDLMLMEYSR